MAEKKDRVDLAADYDDERDPLDYTARAERGAGALADKLRRLAKAKDRLATAKDAVDELQRQIVPEMRQPIVLVINGRRVLASASQAKPIVVNAVELRKALWEHYYDASVADRAMALAEADMRDPGEERDAYEREIESLVDAKMADVLKAPEVDTKEGGLLEQAVADGRIPLEVFGKVAREKPSSAYVKFGPR